MADMNTEVLEVRLNKDQVDEVDAIARERKSDRAAILGEAVDNFLMLRRWEIEHIMQGLREAESGIFASDDEVARVFRRRLA